MLTVEEIRKLAFETAAGLPITRANYHAFADRIYPERATYTDIYAIVGDWTSADKNALLDYLYVKCPELLAYDAYATQKEYTGDWSCMVVFVVLMRQAHDAELAAVREYVHHGQQLRLPC